MEESIVQKFYKDTNVFITGGTGFLGKLLVEKLLRSTQVATIYLLIREKRGKTINTRINELFDDVIFDKLKNENPKFKNRIEPILGDCLIPGLGLNIADRQKITENVNIVFHVAATVRFDENIKLAYKTNVNAIKEVIQLTRAIANLKSIVHISTAYSNCHLNEIEEKFYDYPTNYQQVEQLLEKLNDSEAAEMTPKIIGKWPNTYTFTKALAESYVAENSVGLPLGVFRPAIVISTYKEPIEGWIDNFNGPSGICAGTITGLLRIMLCDQQAITDLVPADTCVSAIICAAWDIFANNNNNNNHKQNIPIYNYVSSPENPITWGIFLNVNRLLSEQYPIMASVYLPMLVTTTNLHIYWILEMLTQFLPAFVVDSICTLTGRKAKLMDTYKKVHKLVDVVSYFGMHSWSFTNKNTVKLWERMNETDKKLFPFSMKNVHWIQYMYNYIKGIRRYLIKDPDTSLVNAKQRHLKLKRNHSILQIFFYFMASIFVYTLLNKMFGFLFK